MKRAWKDCLSSFCLLFPFLLSTFRYSLLLIAKTPLLTQSSTTPQPQQPPSPNSSISSHSIQPPIPHPPSPIFHLPSPSPAPQPFQTPNSARETRHFEMRRRDCAGEGCWAGLGVLVVGREGVERWEVGEEEVGMICSRETRDELSMPRL